MQDEGVLQLYAVAGLLHCEGRCVGNHLICMQCGLHGEDSQVSVADTVDDSLSAV